MSRERPQSSSADNGQPATLKIKPLKK